MPTSRTGACSPVVCPGEVAGGATEAAPPAGRLDVLQEELLREFGVEPLHDVRRLAERVAGDRDRDEHAVEELRPAGVAVAGAGVAGRRVLGDPEVPGAERVERAGPVHSRVEVLRDR